MTDKVQKIREEVQRLQNELIQEKEKGFGSDTDDACILELQNVLTYIDSLQEEPVSEDLKDYINELSKRFPEVSFAKLSRIAVMVAKWQKEKEYTCYEEAFEDGAKWKKEKTIDKACKWIDKNAARYIVDRFVDSTRVVGIDTSITEDFRKDMED